MATTTAAASPEDDPLFNKKGLAAFLKVSKRTIDRLRKDPARNFPRPLPATDGTRIPRWCRDQVKAWLMDQSPKA